MAKVQAFRRGTISISELADMADVSRSTIYDWRRKGLLESIEQGRECNQTRINAKLAKEWVKINVKNGVVAK